MCVILHAAFFIEMSWVGDVGELNLKVHYLIQYILSLYVGIYT